MEERTAKGERTQRAILESAIQRFAANGFRNTSIAEIARDVGISSAAVYVYFADKRELFNEAVDADAEGLISTALPNVIDGSFDFDWSQLFLRLFAGLPQHLLARRVLAGDEGKTSERLIDLPSVAKVRAGLAQALLTGQAEGTVRADVEPEMIAAGVEAIIMSILVTVTQTGGEPDPFRGLGLLAVLNAAVLPTVAV